MLWTLFAKNPFSSLKELMKKTMTCVDKTHDLFDALFAGDKERVHELAKEISQIEHQCDLLRQEIRNQLAKSVFLPVDSRDILHVLSNMDAIADFAEDLGVLLSLRWMELPVSLHEPFNELLKRAHLVVVESSHVIESLDRLLETGFSGPDAEDVTRKIDEIDRLEHLADKAQELFGKALFAHEDEFKPAALFMWIKIANKVGDLANSAERMVNHIRLMLSQS
jgi:predicted phosphate transport protein (TIGR00153 family)